LSSDEKEEYLTFKEPIDPEYEFESYNWNLVHFQHIKDFLVLCRYSDYLRSLMADLTAQMDESIADYHSREPQQKRVLSSKLDESQLSLLTDCMNDLQLFEVSISSDELADFFNCSLPQPLKIARNKNRLLIYLLWQLEARNLISMEWQAVCAREHLLVSHTGKMLSRNNLSSILYQAKEAPPKHSESIDNYVKQLKKA
jgi:hypothetical protein